MRFGFSYIGLIWLIMLFVPNIVWTKNKPQDYEKYTEGENKVLLALERIGQFIVTPVARAGKNRAVYRNACGTHFLGFQFQGMELLGSDAAGFIFLHGSL